MQPLLLLAVALAPQDEITSERYDVRPILAAAAEENYWPWLRPYLHGIDEIYPTTDSFIATNESTTELEAITVAVREAVEAEPGSADEGVIASGDSIEVDANRAGHLAVERTLAALLAHHHDGVLVEAFRVDRALLGGAPSGVLSSAEADALGLAALDAPRYVGRTRWGRIHRIAQEGSIQYLQDYDVEVAQFTSVADPTVNWIHVGLDLGVLVDRGSDGTGMIARVWGRHGVQQDRMRRQEIQAYDGCVIEHPYVDTSTFMASAVIEPGGALVVDSGHVDGRALVVRFRAQIAPREAADVIVDFGGLLAPPMRAEPIELPIVEPSRGLDPAEDEIAAIVAPWIELRGEVDAILDRPFEEGGPHVPAIVGASAIVSTDPVTRSAIRDAVRVRRAQMHAGTVEYTFVLEEVEAATVARALIDPAVLTALCDASESKRIGSAFAFDTLTLMSGMATNHLQDSSVFVAQGAVGGDPIVKRLFDGSRFWASTVEATPDGIVAWIDVAHQEGAEELRTVNSFLTSPKLVGLNADGLAEIIDKLALKIELELGRTRRVRARSHMTLAPGRWEIVTAQPFSGESTVQLIAVKARIVGG